MWRLVDKLGSHPQVPKCHSLSLLRKGLPSARECVPRIYLPLPPTLRCVLLSLGPQSSCHMLARQALNSRIRLPVFLGTLLMFKIDWKELLKTATKEGCLHPPHFCPASGRSPKVAPPSPAPTLRSSAIPNRFPWN